MIRRRKIELYSNEHDDKALFMVKSFIAFYLIQYHKNVVEADDSPASTL